MTVSLSLLAGAGWQFFDNSGNPLSGGRLYTYQAGTTTPAVTYTSSAGTIANSNPVVLDAAGRVPEQIWLDTTYTYKFLLQTSTGVPIWSKDNIPATISSAQVSFIQAGANAVVRSAQSKMRDIVSVKDFGAVGDGVTDDTAAFNAAIAALPADGGTLFIPSANYRINLTITKSGVTLQGETNSRHRLSANKIGLRPFNLSLPVITVGNNTAYVEHVGLQDISIVDDSDSGAQVGLKLAGGAYAFYANNLMIVGFQKYCLHIEGGSTFPVAYVYISNFSFAQGQSSAASDAVVYVRYGPVFTTAIFFVNGRLNNGFGGAERLFLNDSCIPYLINVWFETSNLRGLRILKSDAGAPFPYFVGQNVQVDSNSSSDILLENQVNTSLAMGDFVRGAMTIDGLIQNNASTTAVYSGASQYGAISQFDTFRSRVSAFPDAADPTDESAKISAFGPVGGRTVALTGSGIDLITGANNRVRIFSQTGTNTATLQLNDSLNNRIAQIINSAGEIQLTPPSGYAVRVGDGVWNGRPLRLGNWFFWVDASGNFRIKGSAPTSDTDGTVVGTQT